MKKPTAKAKKVMTKKSIVAYKGFDKDLRCRDFQYAVGNKYSTKESVVCCKYGFHACDMPLDVFNYYGPDTSRYALVESGGEIARLVAASPSPL
ncbi:MAG: DUF7666 domain-containing protein, partial [Candidatus Acidiferrales bacterium]